MELQAMPDIRFTTARDYAEELDAQDDLAHWRQAFVIHDPELIYLDGNSLGRLTLASQQRAQEVVAKEWGEDLVRAWGTGWWQAPSRVGEKVARLIGAAPDQVLVCDSTSSNLFKLTIAALLFQQGRERIVSDDLNFPSDLYILQGCLHLLGHRHQLHLVPSADGIHADERAIDQSIDDRTALVTLSHVAFKSGYLYDAAALTGRAHQDGALVLWDLSHSIGAVPIELDRWGVDLAVGCSYKYLNGGPGSPAFLYVRKGLQERLLSPIWGWFGQESPFAFDLDYRPAPGIARFLVGSPPILSMLALEAALDPLLEAGLDRVRRKSIRLTTYLADLAGAVLDPLGFTLGSPRDPQRRGSHVSLRHPHGYRINRALIEEMKVLPDFREPDNLRLGLSPLYTTYGEVWEAVDRIRRVVVEGRFQKYASGRTRVT